MTAKTHAQRQAKYQAAHLKQHAAKQRAYRARVKQRKEKK